jgi:carboxylesterase
MRWMGEFLNKQGYTCLGIRLGGHATHPEDMVRSRWTDWVASVEDGYQFLHSINQNIVLIGLSMGGVLSLLMATRLELKGVVAMSTPAHLPREYPIWFIEMISRLVPYRRKSKGPPGSTWFDKAAYKEHIAYPMNPVRSTAELKKLILQMRAALRNVTVPVLLIHSKDERYILWQNAEEIFADLVNTPDKTKLYITGSGHVITRDGSRQQVFRAALEFIQRIQN